MAALDGATVASDVLAVYRRRLQYWLDKTTPHILPRWLAFAGVLTVYMLRMWFLDGWYIITYGLGIYLLNLFIGFLSPPMDPESDGPLLPTRSADEEYRPFQRRVSEFTFWLGATRAVFVAFVMTFFSVFNVPVFWPILLLYFLILFTLTMKNQIAHMIKYRYIPISWGKARYGGKGGKGGKPGDGKGGKDGSSSAAAAAFATGAAPDTRFSGSNLK